MNAQPLVETSYIRRDDELAAIGELFVVARIDTDANGKRHVVPLDALDVEGDALDAARTCRRHNPSLHFRVLRTCADYPPDSNQSQQSNNTSLPTGSDRAEAPAAEAQEPPTVARDDVDGGGTTGAGAVVPLTESGSVVVNT